MTEKKKDEGCCGTNGTTGPCCGGKKIIVGILVAALIFVAGMLFAKRCPLGQSGMCPMSGHTAK